MASTPPALPPSVLAAWASVAAGERLPQPVPERVPAPALAELFALAARERQVRAQAVERHQAAAAAREAERSAEAALARERLCQRLEEAKARLRAERARWAEGEGRVWGR